MIIPPDMYGLDGERPYPYVYGLDYGIVTPQSLGNLIAWYKASDFDLVLNGAEVTIWKNSGMAPATLPNNLLLTAAGAIGNRPTVARNSINTTMTSVANTGNRGLVSNVATTYLTSKSSWTWFGVVKFTSRAAENEFMGLTIGVSELRLGITSNGLWTLVYGNVLAGISSAGPSLNDWHYVVVINNADTETLYSDGQAASTWLVTPTIPAANPTDIGVCEAVSALKHTGSIAEVGLFDRAISAGELALLHAYFQTRYALP